MTKFRTHYDNLKVSRDAPDFVIRAAWKTLSQRYHPDKNPGDKRAARVMIIINEAYEVLSDPKRRAEHDEWIRQEEEQFEQPQQSVRSEAPIPPQWRQHDSSGKEESATQHPLSLARSLLYLISLPIKKIFKFAPGLVVLFIIVGMIGLWDMAFPHKPPAGPKPYQAQAAKESTPADSSSYHAAAGQGTNEPNCREIHSSHKDARTGKDTSSVTYSYMKNGARRYTSDRPEECRGELEFSTADPIKGNISGPYSRPLKAPNGNAWPSRAAYVQGYPIGRANGYSEITVDNARNDADVFVKLISLDGDVANPVRHFFIPAGSRFTMNKVTRGNYDIRYRDLDSGKLSRSESFEVEERETYDGFEYSSMTLTLYKVSGGNFHTYELDETEF